MDNNFNKHTFSEESGDEDLLNTAESYNEYLNVRQSQFILIH